MQVFLYLIPGILDGDRETKGVFDEVWLMCRDRVSDEKLFWK